MIYIKHYGRIRPQGLNSNFASFYRLVAMFDGIPNKEFRALNRRRLQNSFFESSEIQKNIREYDLANARITTPGRCTKLDPAYRYFYKLYAYGVIRRCLELALGLENVCKNYHVGLSQNIFDHICS